MVSPILFSTIHIRLPEEKSRVQPLSRTIGEKRTATKRPAFLEQDAGENIYRHVRVLILSYGTSYIKGVDDDLIYKLVENLPNLEIIR